ncbi:formate dehydrogenase subunit gamma [Campylobacter sp. 19-13652]|uniref:formate dehydrogenase subunit gamma n=1 Tax=Campylobacter sp. 19-13652 TaxID=2840180 RepID=UPI001C77AA54|nr:formate dehydrogenase subunit gamma [Campylobacter sp. 19-13652]BCX79988.1 formate dehydrogenase subunit gamma [Campylobacter sp. 19-13652]
MKFLVLLAATLMSAFGIEQPAGTNQYDSAIWAAQRVENITTWGQNPGLGELFTKLQGERIFSYGVLSIAMLVVGAFVLHYLLVGPKHFSHDGKKIFAFSLIVRVAHALAAISWIVLVPTGVMMLWGDVLGGGAFIRGAKNMHGLATIIFAVAVLPLLFSWFYRMLPRIYDIKWLIIVGGYLSKKKATVPAGKFNAGQKMWYWIAIPGGLVMIATGAAMYFLDFGVVSAGLDMSQINLLRLSAIVHSSLGVVCAIFFLVHIYMSAIAIKGAIHSMISGYKEEEEVYYLHHYWYEELLKEGKIEPYSPTENKGH